MGVVYEIYWKIVYNNFPEISEIPENSEKITEKLRGVFRVNTMQQIENLVFMIEKT